MLHLKSESQARWLRQVDENLDEILALAESAIIDTGHPLPRMHS
jgi:hypothetical protein